METLKSIDDLITAVTGDTEKIVGQFGSKSATKTEKETIIASANNINLQMTQLKVIAENYH